ncbi:hypothetical protein WICPIJ_009630 [Wickerhamomyces pijperi]|uniref:Translation initiation factor eIF2B subunit delta n=1 Tax=Wickerhamomyces pijperi TaxID=599730 RepID=A0A9P8PLJ8_WICPI|nr:hypothetical protein WICPIJ_009630 [Wickerhamomyces pijperi]
MSEVKAEAEKAKKPQQTPGTTSTTATKKPASGSEPAKNADGTPKLTNKELKELKKQEKLAKRAAQKESAGIVSKVSAEQIAQNKNKKNQPLPVVEKKATVKKPEKKNSLFSHLETKEHRNELSLNQSQTLTQIHPSIISLTLKISSYSIVGSIPRCKAMLETFTQVISDYQTPEGTTLTRNLTNYLSLQIDYLKTSRPLSVSMGNAIRWLKQQISLISIDLSESQAKTQIIASIDDFIREKIEYAGKVIIDNASQHITNNSKILTFGNSQVLGDLFLHNHLVLNKTFQVIIVDSHPLFEGKALAQKLSASGLSVKYVLINSLSTTFQDNIDFVFLGAHSMLSNGFLYSRVGSALIAMKAKNKNIPVLVCCESVKFSDRVQLDSVTSNELADSELLIPEENKGRLNISLRNFKKNHEAKPEDTQSETGKKGKQQQQQQQQKKKELQQQQDAKKDDFELSNWKNNQYLNIVSVMYDLTPPEYIQKIITEVGALPPSSVPVILREYKSGGAN